MPAAVSYEAVLRLKLGHLAGGRVLDVATGRGIFARNMADCLASFDKIVGIDIDEKPLEEARERFDEKNIRFQQGDADNIEFEDAGFDTVAMSNSIHHLPEPGRTLAEIMRVLRPGGLLLLKEPFRDNQNPPQMTHVLLHHWHAELNRRSGITHRRSYLRREIVRMVESLELVDPDLFDLVFDDRDPKDEETRKSTLERIDKALADSKKYGFDQEFKVRGMDIRQRVIDIGFLPATELMAIGRKP